MSSTGALKQRISLPVQKMAVERARSGEIGIRPSERRRQVEEAQLAAGGGAYGGPKPDGYGALLNVHPHALNAASLPQGARHFHLMSYVRHRMRLQCSMADTLPQHCF